VRVEQADLLAARLPDGAELRYTTSLARVREAPGAELLASGSAALTAMLGEVAAHAAVVSLRLSTADDAEALARANLATAAKGCERCLHPDGASRAPCEACPLHEGRFVAAGFEKLRSVREVRRWDESSIELAYEVTARDRYGRTDDLVRVALGPDGATLPILTPTALARAEGYSLPPEAPGALRASLAQVRPTIELLAREIGAFLGLRSAAEYARRREELAGTFAALRHEAQAAENGAGAASGLARALETELRRLDEVYGGDVEVRLASVAFVATTLVEMVLTDARHREWITTVDVGRGCIRSLASRQGANVASPAIVGDTPADVARADGTLTVAALAALPPSAWAACVRWLLECRGLAPETIEEAGGTLLCRGTYTGKPFAVSATRPPQRAALGVGEVRRAAAAAAGAPGTTVVLLATAPVAEQAHAEAQRLGVELWDQNALSALLIEQASTFERNAQRRRADLAKRITLASAVREQALGAMEAVEAALIVASDVNKLASQPKVAAAAAALEHAHGVALRALLAFETLAAELRAAFASRPARDGSLEVTASEDAFHELGERASHLRAAALAAARDVAGQPTVGEFGYTAWRAALVEELTARCEVVRWHLLALDPAEWRDFARAHNGQAAAQAEAAATNAGRAGARTTAARTALARRARLAHVAQPTSPQSTLATEATM
jgi:hypothetical protein